MASASVAQSSEEQQARTLLQTAERLEQESSDVEPVLRAYERALIAYDGLSNADKGVEILSTLFSITRTVCRYDESIGWAQAALQRLESPRLSFELHAHEQWVERLSGLYRQTNQSSSVRPFRLPRITPYADSRCRRPPKLPTFPAPPEVLPEIFPP